MTTLFGDLQTVGTGSTVRQDLRTRLSKLPFVSDYGTVAAIEVDCYDAIVAGFAQVGTLFIEPGVDAVIDTNYTIASGKTLVVMPGASLTIASGKTLTATGTLLNLGGTVTVTGTLSGAGDLVMDTSAIVA